MFGSLMAFPILVLLIILQTTLVNQITLLHGCADLILLWLAAWGLQKQVKSAWLWTAVAAISMAYISAIPWYVPLIGYGITTYLARAIIKRVWQSPLLMMYLVTVAGALITYGLTYVGLLVGGVNIPIKAGFVQVIIPSVLINLLFALPMYVLVKDAAKWIYPLEAGE